jgi:GNAT superfamily N-acetyltransferase
VADHPPAESEHHAGAAGADKSALEGLSFRPAGLPDIDAVVALVESAYRGDSSRAGWTTEADLLDGQRTDSGEVRDLLGRAGSRILLAELDKAPVATCHLQRTGRTARFGMFAVRPGLQGGGIGRAVVAEAFRVLSGWGCDEISMAVIGQRTELIAWYERLGFRPTGETEPFPYGDARFGLPRRDDLHFVVLSAPVGSRSSPESAPASPDGPV